MFIAIDESGSFAATPSAGSWNCVVAYVFPEVDKRKIQDAVRRLRIDAGKLADEEVKLKDISEDQYIRFLDELCRHKGICFGVATDASSNTPEIIEAHRAGQARKIRENIPHMKYDSGKDGIEDLASRIEAVSLPLYVQMILQLELVDWAWRFSTLMFSQTVPSALAKFRWRIDQKNSTKTEYEVAYQQILGPFLQSRSIDKPFSQLAEGNYKHLERFIPPRGKTPNYLETQYGIKPKSDLPPILLNEILREDFQFVDSRQHFGVQVANLLASGLRRCLRSKFRNNVLVAKRIGGLMLQPKKGDQSLRLVALGPTSDGENSIPDPPASTIFVMTKHSQHFLFD